MAFSKVGRAPRIAPPSNKAEYLARPQWIHSAYALHHGITREELTEHWLKVGADAAADPVVDHTDDLQRGTTVRRYLLHTTMMGWSTFAEKRKGDRKPALLVSFPRSGKNRKPQYAPIEPSKRRDQLVPLADLHAEADNDGVHNCNLAVVLGPASAHLRAIDIDCLDPKLSAEVQRLAFEILGETPFVRVGRAPKSMLFYRVEGQDIDIPTSSTAFMDMGFKDPNNALEFLGAGRNATIYGLHHKTGESFDWSQGKLHPAIASSMEAPVITKQQLKRFYKEVNDVRPLDRFNAITGSSPIGGESEITSFEKAPGNVWIPKNFSGSYSIDDQGYIVDGREKFVTSMCWAFCSANVDLLRTQSGQEAVFQSYMAHSRCYVQNTGKWAFDAMPKICRTKFNSALRKWLDAIDHFDRSGKWPDRVRPWRILEDGSRPMAQHVSGADRPVDGSLDWLPEQPSIMPGLAGPQKIKGIISPEKAPEKIAADKAERALFDNDEDMIAHHGDISAKVDTAIDRFLGSILGQEDPDSPIAAPLSILKAPTGAGKTSRAVMKLAAFCKDNPRKPGQGPILVCLPTHENISEALVKAEASGMTVPDVSEIDENDIAAKLNQIGVQATVFQGKIRAGCQRAEEMLALTSKGIGASRLCGATVEEGGDETLARMKRRDGEEVESEEVLCPFRERGECRYWNQIGDVETADIVFLPHSYLTMPSLPKALKEPRAVIIDESIVYRVLGQSTFPLKTLEEGRRIPFITKREIADADGKDREDLEFEMTEGRDAVAKTVMTALSRGKCPSQAVIDAGQIEDVERALKVVKRSHIDERSLSPLSDMTKIEELTSKPFGAHLHDEERFWRIIAERIEAIQDGTATGDHDARIQLVWDAPKKPIIRISWRAKMNWQGRPTLLLDASASPNITAKLFGVEPEDVVVHDIDTKMNVRTIVIPDRPYANRAFRPPQEAENAEIAASEQLVKNTRKLISKLAGVYSHARVLVGSTKSTRDVLNHEGYARPRNVDSVHYGALRGLDFAKGHMCALSIGRSEQPIRVIDAYKAALTYDDDVPEKPYDILGTGRTVNDKVLFREMEQRVFKMRTGHDVLKAVPEMPKGWARELEHQWREEEIRQFLGRLRPVYRMGEVPTYICMTSMVPDNVIVDEMIGLDDMLEDADIFGLLRVTDGVLLAKDKPDHPSVAEAMRGKTVQEFLIENIDRPEYKERLVSTFSHIHFKLRGVEQDAWVAGWHADPVEALMAHFLQKGQEPEILKVTPPARGFVEGTVREPDAVDMEMLAPNLEGFEDLQVAKIAREKYLLDMHRVINESGRWITLPEIESAYRVSDLREFIMTPDEEEWERLEQMEFDGDFDHLMPPHVYEEISASRVAWASVHRHGAGR